MATEHIKLHRSMFYYSIFVKPLHPSFLNWPASDGRGGEVRETGCGLAKNRRAIYRHMPDACMLFSMIAQPLFAVIGRSRQPSIVLQGDGRSPCTVPIGTGYIAPLRTMRRRRKTSPAATADNTASPPITQRGHGPCASHRAALFGYSGVAMPRLHYSLIPSAFVHQSCCRIVISSARRGWISRNPSPSQKSAPQIVTLSFVRGRSCVAATTFAKISARM